MYTTGKIAPTGCKIMRGVNMNYYNEIKNELISNEINRKVKNYSINKSDLNTYYNVGKLLLEAGKHYGEGIIKEYSQKLKYDLNKNYSVRLLYRMLKYYNFVSEEKLPTLSAKLSWSHYDEILRFDDINKIAFYIKISEQQNLSVRQLREKIKSNEYERLPIEAKNKLINQDESNVVDFVKNPIMIRNSDKYNIFSEKVLQKLILEDIENFLDELGSGFTFIKSEYPIKIGGRYNYIDLLLYNIEFNCYVVIELKVTELKKEYIGQMEMYMNYIDKNVKKINHDKTVGIIIVRKDNKFVMEYCSNKNIFRTTYELV